MSAIFGRFNLDGRPVSSSELDSMQQAMAYWGPDGDGQWTEGPVGLGCLRRDNTPESVGENLPWVCPDSGDVITASARLDNRDELFESLSVPTPERAGVPDSRIILEAYHQWGTACVDRLLGDWVFAIWDAGERKLFVGRDHHGNTGLYYHTDSRCFTFASSLKGLLALPDVPNRPDPLTIAKAMTSWPEFGDRTCNEGLLRLLPAHALTVTADRVAGETLLPGLEELLTPPVIQIRRDPLSSAQRGDALFAAQALENDPNLLFGRKSAAGPPPDLPHSGFARLLLLRRH